MQFPEGFVEKYEKILGDEARDFLASFEEEAVSANEPTTFQVQQMSLRCALRNLLRPHGLAAIVRDGAIVVTSELESDNNLVTGIYPVADLLGIPPDSDSLIQLIEEVVDSNSWS